MKKVIKMLLFFVLFLALYIIPSIYAPFDKTWYDTLNKPMLTPQNYVFSIVWTILFVLISLHASITLTTKTDYSKKCYIITLLFNYIFIQLYSYIQFKFKNLEIAFVDVLLVLLTTLMLYVLGNKINKKASLLLIPLIIWLIFASFLQVGLIRLNS